MLFVTLSFAFCNLKYKLIVATAKNVKSVNSTEHYNIVKIRQLGKQEMEPLEYWTLKPSAFMGVIIRSSHMMSAEQIILSTSFATIYTSNTELTAI